MTAYVPMYYSKKSKNSKNSQKLVVLVSNPTYSKFGFEIRRNFWKRETAVKWFGKGFG